MIEDGVSFASTLNLTIKFQTTTIYAAHHHLYRNYKLQ